MLEATCGCKGYSTVRKYKYDNVAIIRIVYQYSYGTLHPVRDAYMARGTGPQLVLLSTGTTRNGPR